MKKLLLTALLATLPAASAATLVFGGNGDPISLEPANVTDGISILVQLQIYDTLIDFKDGTTTLVPGLATSWTPNANATSWTFKLRPNVKFHDGTAMNADAIVFNLRRWWDKADPYGFRDQGRTFEIIGDLLGGYKGDPTAVIKNIVKVDSLTVRVDLNKPSSVLPDVLASGYFGIAISDGHQERRRQVRHAREQGRRHRPLYLPELAYRGPRGPDAQQVVLGREGQG